MLAYQDPIRIHRSRWESAKQHRAAWTREARTDLKFAAGKTWTPQELAVFQDEGRRPTDYNLVLPMLNLVSGIEAQTRSDIKVLPRAPRDVETAEALTKILKYVSDQNNQGRQLSRAFRDCIALGIGWMEVGYNPDIMAEPIMSKRIDPFDIWIDPSCRQPDLSDAKEIFRAVWVDAEDLAARYPKHREAILNLATDRDDQGLISTGDYTRDEGDIPPVSLWEDDGVGQAPSLLDKTRRPLRPVERWYRADEKAVFCLYRDGRIVEVTQDNALECARAILSGEASRREGMAKRVRVAVFVGDLLLEEAASPYTHGRFPFVPLWAYEDEKGRPMGLIRLVRDPQKEFNARRTHMLKRALSRQVWYEEGAFADVDQAREEMALHDGMVAVNRGALASGMVQIRDNLESTPIEADLLMQAKVQIQDATGVTPELMGRQTNANSGKAIEARQNQGQTTLYTLFDNRNGALEQIGEMELALVQDTYTQEQAIRITESNKGLGFITINQRQPDGTILNNITQGRYDTVVAEVPASPTEQLAQFQALAEFLEGVDPMIKVHFLPDLMKLGNLPNALEYAEKAQAIIDRLTNPAPAAPPGGLPPEAAGPMEGVMPPGMPV